MTDVFKYLMKYEKKWCSTMGYVNPYIDNFTIHLTDKMPFYDKECYDRYPRFKNVYDKLWIIKSQGLAGGRLEKLAGKEEKVVYPIFIKPRWGHLSASSKNCFKVNDADELKKYIGYKHMMWSEFIDATECMTDFVLLKGKIVHQITYQYSDKQNGFSDDWKVVSPDLKPPANIVEWVKINMTEFTGVVNAQYRDNKIIEISLRLARGGAYIISTQNEALIKNINNIFLHKTWDYNLTEEMKFKPFYVYKCFTLLPIIYIFPQKIVDWYIKGKTNYPFYEYYFEPTGSSGMVFFQFIDDDFERGMQTKKEIEKVFNIAQIVMYVLLFILIYVLSSTTWEHRYLLAFVILFLFSTRFFNPIGATYKLYKGQKQSIFKEGPSNDTEDDLEPFDNP
jgi:hypothetical protein